MRPGGGPQGEGLSRPAVLVAAAAGTLLYLTAAVRAPLLPDEMYYWDWSRHLAAGYFDHPPLIAYAIRLGTALLGDSPQGVRLIPLLCGLLTAVCLYCSARLLGGKPAARRALLVAAGLPLLTGSFLLATPDAPFLAATACLMYALLRAVDASERSGSALPWWAAAGAAAGLAMQSKYTALLLFGAAGLAFLIHRPLRRLLRTPGPWVALLLALAVQAPVLLWNSHHDWISLRFQLVHGLGASMGGNTLKRELSFLGGQVGIVNPMLLFLLSLAVWRALRDGTSALGLLLAVVAASIFGFFAISASRRPVEANWPAPAYLPAVVLLAALPLGLKGRRWLGAGAGLGIGLTAVALLHLITPILPLAREVDQIADSYGWPPVADAVRQVVTAERAAGRRVFIAGNRYQETATLAFHLPDHPAVLSLNVDYRPNQYDLWPSFESRAVAGDGLLLVIEPGSKADSVVERLTGSFTEVRRGVEVERRRGGRVLSPRDLWLFEGWRGGPLPRGFRP